MMEFKDLLAKFDLEHPPHIEYLFLCWDSGGKAFEATACPTITDDGLVIFSTSVDIFYSRPISCLDGMFESTVMRVQNLPAQVG